MKIPEIALSSNRIAVTVSGKHMPFQRRRECLNCGKKEVQKGIPPEKKEKWHVFFWETLQRNEINTVCVKVEPVLFCRDCSYAFVSMDEWKGAYAYIPLVDILSLDLRKFTFCETVNGEAVIRDVLPEDFISAENAKRVGVR